LALFTNQTESNIMARIGDRDGDVAEVDDLAPAIVVIQEPHWATHRGFMHHISGKVTGMITANVDDYLLVTPALNFPHIRRLQFDFGSGDIDVQIYEDSTASADGSPLTSFNTNRNSSNTPLLVFNDAPTITGVGTLMHTTWVVPTAAGIGGSAEGISGVTSGEEWILKPSTKYLVRVTNNSGDTIAYRYELLWYELNV
jgi:hypothetical protein